MMQLAGLDPELRPYAEAAISTARQYGISVTVTSARRTWAQQTELREHWLRCVSAGKAYSTDPALHCQYPANAPGDSAHNYGLAFDSVVEPRFQHAWNVIRQWHGFRVPENDIIHAEVPNWRAYATEWRGQVG